MKLDHFNAMRELAYFSSLGLQMALSIFIGLAIGVYLDGRLGSTAPWLTLIWLGLGIAAAYRNVALAIRKSRRL